MSLERNPENSSPKRQQATFKVFIKVFFLLMVLALSIHHFWMFYLKLSVLNVLHLIACAILVFLLIVIQDFWFHLFGLVAQVSLLFRVLFIILCLGQVVISGILLIYGFLLILPFSYFAMWKIGVFDVLLFSEGLTFFCTAGLVLIALTYYSYQLLNLAFCLIFESPEYFICHTLLQKKKSNEMGFNEDAPMPGLFELMIHPKRIPVLKYVKKIISTGIHAYSHHPQIGLTFLSN